MEVGRLYNGSWLRGAEIRGPTGEKKVGGQGNLPVSRGGKDRT